jgi:hypothetical protein
VDARSGSGTGLPAAPGPLFFQGGGGAPGSAEPGDRFATALAS